ncbi:TPA: ADP-ribosylglycohydrolase family protein [Streptococcus suis]|uniref:ADP-ribosylglycohydrolase family protein n=1 Tax=Streptococcus suis TaxID=1307 RepID=UPI0004099186|nr:ADP-ribosylglycohydrolase family protein [Streptococcus suis]UUM56271.1 ADP-ribosylglycohydrolase family protein [Streptococcus suis]HEL1804938.1 ADP-ribosylglycohydrolase family protein [Streptococcus suis]HEL1815054.1 ADP-ribosylglycohydrolase family protein [Streptococcus suis]HEL1896868.1 ADP-ribosylglycohydrolase family protein [Streptococcus suis]HEL1936055.1 ADP-ribosylglycohydrolase family protein [Streptococcus suis]
MFGAIVGDVIGSRFEGRDIKSKDFDLFHPNCRFTDDSVMTAAVAASFLGLNEPFDDLEEALVLNMKDFGKLYPRAGYGPQFKKWIESKDSEPYNSFGNGSAIRVSACGHVGKSLEETLDLAERVAFVTHNHPEGIKGAQAVAGAIFLARTGKSKEEIRQFVTDNFYNLDFTLDAIRPSYQFDSSCQGSVPQAIVAFLEAEDFEDAIRNAVSLGGDSDTLAAIAGSIAEPFFGIPEEIVYRTTDYLPSLIMEVSYYFEQDYPSKGLRCSHMNEGQFEMVSLFQLIDDCVDRIIPKGAPVEILEEYPNGAIKVQPDEQFIQLDFSSFDKNLVDKARKNKEHAPFDVVVEGVQYVVDNSLDILGQLGNELGKGLGVVGNEAGKVVQGSADFVGQLGNELGKGLGVVGNEAGKVVQGSADFVGQLGNELGKGLGVVGNEAGKVVQGSADFVGQLGNELGKGLGVVGNEAGKVVQGSADFVGQIGADLGKGWNHLWKSANKSTQTRDKTNQKSAEMSGVKKEPAKKMHFDSMESLQSVVHIVNEADLSILDPNRIIADSPLKDVLAMGLGAGLGGVVSYSALYGLGTVGLSAAGITSGLAAAGALVGGGMVAGLFVLAAPVAILAGGGLAIVNILTQQHLQQEKKRLYKVALQKHQAIIEALKSENQENKERIDYLTSLNILLQKAIEELKEDIGTQDESEQEESI